MDTLKLKMCSIAIFRSVAESPLIKAVEQMISNLQSHEDFLYSNAKIYSILALNGRVRTLGEEIFALLKVDENPLSLSFLSGAKPKKEIIDRAEKEYGFFCDICNVSLDEQKEFQSIKNLVPKWEAGKLPPFSSLISSYKNNGCGVFARSCAFIWDDGAKKMCAVENIDKIKLSCLKDYAEEKQIICDNTEAFIKDLPANNILLYGDRGTGKSSTVHAVLNKYAYSGLKLLEVRKSAITDFPIIIPLLNRTKLKFIIFIDDLSFAGNDNNYSELKAALEGSVEKSKNVLIYATSNRRHLVREQLSDRDGDELHIYDEIEEQLSLSDRFGIVISFVNPEKAGFLSILRQILSERKISVDDTELMHLAERYAVKKGGRSPRAAKQLADMIESAVRRGKEIEI